MRIAFINNFRNDVLLFVFFCMRARAVSLIIQTIEPNLQKKTDSSRWDQKIIVYELKNS